MVELAGAARWWCSEWPFALRPIGRNGLLAPMRWGSPSDYSSKPSARVIRTLPGRVRAHGRITRGRRLLLLPPPPSPVALIPKFPSTEPIPFQRCLVLPAAQELNSRCTPLKIHRQPYLHSGTIAAERAQLRTTQHWRGGRARAGGRAPTIPRETRGSQPR